MDNFVLFLSTADIPACQMPTVLQLIYFGKIILNIVHIILPICLIIFMMVDFGMCVITGDDSKQGKIVKNSFKRIFYAIIVYIVPYIVSLCMSLLADFVPDYSLCITNATPENIAIFTAKYDEELKKERAERKETWMNSTSQKFNYTKTQFASNYDNLYQFDSRWEKYPLCKEGSTVRNAGCGYVSYTMVLRSLGYKNVTPEEIVDVICGEYEKDPSKYHKTGYEGSGLSAGVLISPELNDRYDLTGRRISYNDIEDELRKGNSIIVLMPGHWISILDINEDGNLLVGDSAFGFGTAYNYNLKTLYNATANDREPKGWHAVLSFSKK